MPVESPAVKWVDLGKILNGGDSQDYSNCKVLVFDIGLQHLKDFWTCGADMAGRRKYGFTEKKIARFIREGRGRGVGREYKPWLTVSDVPSKGREHRVFWYRTEREHHLLSDNEYRAFLSFTWLERVIDIREQFPHDRGETMEIALRLGVRPPVFGGTILVMTTDLLVTELVGGQPVLSAYSIKEAEAKLTSRDKELSQIEECIWKERDIPLEVLYRHDVKTEATKNLEWIFGLNGLYPVLPSDDEVYWTLRVYQKKHPMTPIATACKDVDELLGRRTGTSLAALRRLIGARKIIVDLNRPLIQRLEMREFFFESSA